MKVMKSFAERQSARPTFAVVLTAALLGLPGAALAQAASAQVPANFSHLAKTETPAVVAILTRQQIVEQAAPDSPFGEALRRFYGAPRQKEERMALGSGFVIDNQGDIVTANHVIDNATDIHVRFSDGTTEAARLVGADPDTDVAVLRVKPPKGMVVAHWGDSAKVEPGDWVVAIGSPFGLGGTVTVGVLSARSRNPITGRIGGLLQTDASINKGNSGGPLFDAEGEVIGVNDAIVSPSGGNIGIGFAVPSEIAQQVANELMKSGKVSRGFIGARIQDVTPGIAQALGLKADSGALIASVESGGPADHAGLKPGEVITKVDSQQISGSRDLVQAIASDKPGKTVDVTVASAGGQKSVEVKLGERPTPNEQTTTSSISKGADNSGQQGANRLGIEIAPYHGSRGGPGPDLSGLAVTAVVPGSTAAAGGLQRGDIIVSADGKSVSQPADLQKAWQSDQQKNKPTLLRVYRDGKYAYLAAG